MPRQKPAASSMKKDCTNEIQKQRQSKETGNLGGHKGRGQAVRKTATAFHFKGSREEDDLDQNEKYSGGAGPRPGPGTDVKRSLLREMACKRESFFELDIFGEGRKSGLQRLNNTREISRGEQEGGKEERAGPRRAAWPLEGSKPGRKGVRNVGERKTAWGAHFRSRIDGG